MLLLRQNWTRQIRQLLSAFILFPPLPAHAQLTLVTDGVVEAHGKSSELFGFNRTAAISTQPADSIAQTAQAYGQDDDITVLTLTRIATPQPALA